MHIYDFFVDYLFKILFKLKSVYNIELYTCCAFKQRGKYKLLLLLLWLVITEFLRAFADYLAFN